MIYSKILLVFLLLQTIIYAQTPNLEKVKLQLQWKYQFQFAGFIMAKELGYYKDVGLDVEILEYNNTNSIQDLEAGIVDYVINNSLLAYHDKKLNDVTLLATYFQRSPLIIITQPEIKSALDLKNKKIMMSENNRYNSSLSILLEYFSINGDNANFVPTTFNLDDFITRKVDAFTGFRSNELFELDQRGIPYNVIDPVEYGFSTNAINLFASHQKVKNNPQQIKDFLSASKKGWVYALDHIDEVAKLIHDKYQPNRSLENLTYEGKVTKEMMLLNLYDIGEINREFVLKTFDQLVKNSKLDKDQNPKDIMFDDVKTKDIWKMFVSLFKTFLTQINETVVSIFIVFVFILFLLRKFWLAKIRVEINKKALIQERLSLAIEGSNDGIWDWNLKTNEVYFSPRWKEILGYKDNEIKNEFAVWEDLVHSDDIQNAKDEINNLINSSDKDLRYSIKFRMLHKDGHYVPILSRAKKIVNLDGELIRLIGTHLDLTELVAMEDAYKKERDRSQLYLDTAEVLLIALDTQGRVTMLNRKGEELLGYKEIEILGKAWFDIGVLPKEIEVKMRQFFDNLIFMKDLSNKTIEHILLDKNGQELIVSFRNSILLGQNGEVLGVLSSGTDVTEKVKVEKEFQRQKEQLFKSEKMAAMGLMIGNIAHQWRQPLSAITVAASSIQLRQELGTLSDVNLNAACELININAHYLSQTIDDFRNFIKGDREKSTFNLKSNIESFMGLVEGTIKSNSLNVILKLDENITITSYPNELIQCLMNIFIMLKML